MSDISNDNNNHNNEISIDNIENQSITNNNTNEIIIPNCDNNIDTIESEIVQIETSANVNDNDVKSIESVSILPEDFKEEGIMKSVDDSNIIVNKRDELKEDKPAENIIHESINENVVQNEIINSDTNLKSNDIIDNLSNKENQNIHVVEQVTPNNSLETVESSNKNISCTNATNNPVDAKNIDSNNNKQIEGVNKSVDDSNVIINDINEFKEVETAEVIINDSIDESHVNNPSVLQIEITNGDTKVITSNHIIDPKDIANNDIINDSINKENDQVADKVITNNTLESKDNIVPATNYNNIPTTGTIDNSADNKNEDSNGTKQEEDINKSVDDSTIISTDIDHKLKDEAVEDIINESSNESDVKTIIPDENTAAISTNEFSDSKGIVNDEIKNEKDQLLESTESLNVVESSTNINKTIPLDVTTIDSTVEDKKTDRNNNEQEEDIHIHYEIDTSDQQDNDSTQSLSVTKDSSNSISAYLKRRTSKSSDTTSKSDNQSDHNIEYYAEAHHLMNLGFSIKCSCKELINTRGDVKQALKNLSIKVLQEACKGGKYYDVTSIWKTPVAVFIGSWLSNYEIENSKTFETRYTIQVKLSYYKPITSDGTNTPTTIPYTINKTYQQFKQLHNKLSEITNHFLNKELKNLLTFQFPIDSLFASILVRSKSRRRNERLDAINLWFNEVIKIPELYLLYEIRYEIEVFLDIPNNLMTALPNELIVTEKRNSFIDVISSLFSTNKSKETLDNHNLDDKIVGSNPFNDINDDNDDNIKIDSA